MALGAHSFGYGGIMHRDTGGSTDPSIGGVTPTTQTQNPLTQGMIQRYSSMSPEQLQQLAVQMGGSPQSQIIQRVLQQKRIMSAQQQQSGQPNQSQAQAPSATAAPTQAQARGGATIRRDAGGVMSGSEATPWWSRSEARGEASGGANGFLNGSTPGRADAIKTTAPAGAYVLPADVVSGLGEGNSLAGAGVVQRMLQTGPHGIPMPRGGSGHSIPRPPEPARATGGGMPKEPQYGYVSQSRSWDGPALYRATGGRAGGQTPVALSHGEFVIAPHHVARFGGGDHTKGVKYFDRFVVAQRKKHIAKLKSLPGPVKTT